MAWEYLGDVNELTGNPGYSTNSNITWEALLTQLNNSSTGYVDNSQSGFSYVAGSGDYYSTETKTVTTSYGLTITYTLSSSGAGILFSATGVTENIGGLSTGSQRKIGFKFVVNHDTHKAKVMVLHEWQSGNWQYTTGHTGDGLGSEQWYNFLMAHVPSPYNWESVASLTGKGKTIQLPQLVSTDGQPVTSGTSSDFSSLPNKAKVRALAESNY